MDLDLPLRALLGRCSRKRRRRISLEATNHSPISKLEEDSLVEILIRSFPDPKSACRCKAVCKNWSSLISSPYFNRRFVSHQQAVNLHRPPMPQNPNELQSIILSFLPPIPNRLGGTLKVLDCFKDLVLCGFWDLDHENGELGRSYLICNPFTKQWIALPLAPKKLARYYNPVARLVCKPRITKNLDLGDDLAFIYHDYHFRVVCMYQCDAPPLYLKLDVFCSESGEWIKEALVLESHLRLGVKTLSSCNGELFWMYSTLTARKLVAKFNPFRLDIPLTNIDTSPFYGEDMWLTSSSQGALHVISYHSKIKPLRPIVWRLEEDCKSWRKLYQGLVENPRCCSREEQKFFLPFLHPHNPAIVLFLCTGCESSLLSCDLRREEIELVVKLEEDEGNIPFAKVFEPRVCCWLTPIPRYKELRGKYDGSNSLWVQGSSEATTPSLDNCMKTMADLLEGAFFKTKEDHHIALIRRAGFQLVLYGNHLRQERDALSNEATQSTTSARLVQGKLDAASQKFKELAAEIKNAQLKAAEAASNLDVVRTELDECEKKLLEKDILLIVAQEKIEALENALGKKKGRAGEEAEQSHKSMIGIRGKYCQ